jgi:hypothetical protein
MCMCLYVHTCSFAESDKKSVISGLSRHANACVYVCVYLCRERQKVFDKLAGLRALMCGDEFLERRHVVLTDFQVCCRDLVAQL